MSTTSTEPCSPSMLSPPLSPGKSPSKGRSRKAIGFSFLHKWWFRHSQYAKVLDNKLASDTDLQQTFKKFMLTKNQIRHIYHFFLHLGASCSKTEELTLTDFKTIMFEREDSMFIDHLFQVSDSDRNLMICFNEFIAMLSTFCCFSEVQMVKFAFNTFDVDGDGAIGVAELRALLMKMDSRTADVTKAARRVMNSIDNNDKRTINIDEFAQMNLQLPSLLWPAFRLQYRVQEVTLGLGGWNAINKKMAQRRKERQQDNPGSFLRKKFLGRMSNLFSHKSKTFPDQSDPVSVSHSSISSSHATRKLNPDRIALRRKNTRTKVLSVVSQHSMNSHTGKGGGQLSHHNASKSLSNSQVLSPLSDSEGIQGTRSVHRSYSTRDTPRAVTASKKSFTRGKMIADSRVRMRISVGENE